MNRFAIFRQSFRYAVVGIATNLLLYATYMLLAAFMVPEIAMTISYAVGVLVSFSANRNWSFGHRGKVSAALPKYLAAYMVGYLINLLILMAGVKVYQLPHQAVQAVGILVVAVCMFLMHRFWVFASTDERGVA